MLTLELIRLKDGKFVAIPGDLHTEAASTSKNLVSRMIFEGLLKLPAFFSGTVEEVVRYVLTHGLEVREWVVGEEHLDEVRKIERSELDASIHQSVKESLW